MPEDKIPPRLVPLIEFRRKITQIADESNLSVARLAVGYLLSQPGITSIVMGMESVEQLRENLPLMSDAPLPSDLMVRLKTVVGLLPEHLIRPMLWAT